MSVFNKIGLPSKDLSDIEYVMGYSCPNCKTFPDDGQYFVDNISYPQCFNEVLYSTMDGTIHDWDEVHKCPNCKLEYCYTNGSF